MTELGDWISGRTPAAPVEFAKWLNPEVEASGCLSSALLDEALRSLNRALAHPGRDREGALHLLAADGFLTYACEAATEADDVGATLRNLVERTAAA